MVIFGIAGHFFKKSVECSNFKNEHYYIAYALCKWTFQFTKNLKTDSLRSMLKTNYSNIRGLKLKVPTDI